MAFTRGVVIGLGRGPRSACERTYLTRYDLFNADECFLTGTGAELSSGENRWARDWNWQTGDRSQRVWSKNTKR